MKRLNSYLRALVSALGLALLTGCSGGSSLDTEYVEGVVTMNGAPVPDATVMFVPVSEGQGLSATGMTDAKGNYRLTAANTGVGMAAAGKGTLPGEYFVGVTKSIQEPELSEEEAFDKGVKYVAPKPGQAPKVTHVVPKKYNKAKESGLTATVKEGKNIIPLELTGQ